MLIQESEGGKKIEDCESEDTCQPLSVNGGMKDGDLKTSAWKA